MLKSLWISILYTAVRVGKTGYTYTEWKNNTINQMVCELLCKRINSEHYISIDLILTHSWCCSSVYKSFDWIVTLKWFGKVDINVPTCMGVCIFANRKCEIKSRSERREKVFRNSFYLVSVVWLLLLLLWCLLYCYCYFCYFNSPFLFVFSFLFIYVFICAYHTKILADFYSLLLVYFVFLFFLFF